MKSVSAPLRLREHRRRWEWKELKGRKRCYAMLTSGNGTVIDPPGWLPARDLPVEDEAKQHSSWVGKELMSSLLPQEL